METMNEQILEPQYNPDKLLDSLLNKLHLKNDAALSRILEVAPPVISKIRHRRLPVGAAILIRMHEVSEMSIADLRELLGDRRKKFRLSPVQGLPKSRKRYTGYLRLASPSQQTLADHVRRSDPTQGNPDS